MRWRTGVGHGAASLARTGVPRRRALWPELVEGAGVDRDLRERATPRREQQHAAKEGCEACPHAARPAAAEMPSATTSRSLGCRIGFAATMSLTGPSCTIASSPAASVT
jgi:hypothetical protein